MAGRRRGGGLERGPLPGNPPEGPSHATSPPGAPGFSDIPHYQTEVFRSNPSLHFHIYQPRPPPRGVVACWRRQPQRTHGQRGPGHRRQEWAEEVVLPDQTTPPSPRPENRGAARPGPGLRRWRPQERERGATFHETQPRWDYGEAAAPAPAPAMTGRETGGADSRTLPTEDVHGAHLALEHWNAARPGPAQAPSDRGGGIADPRSRRRTSTSPTRPGSAGKPPAPVPAPVTTDRGSGSTDPHPEQRTPTGPARPWLWGAAGMGARTHTPGGGWRRARICGGPGVNTYSLHPSVTFSF